MDGQMDNKGMGWRTPISRVGSIYWPQLRPTGVAGPEIASNRCSPPPPRGQIAKCKTAPAPPTGMHACSAQPEAPGPLCPHGLSTGDPRETSRPAGR